MAAAEQRTAYNGEEDIDEEDDEEDDDLNPSSNHITMAAVPVTATHPSDVVVDDEDDDVDVDDDDVDDSTSSSNLATADTDASLHHLPPIPIPPLPSVTAAAGVVTNVLPVDLAHPPDQKRLRTGDVSVAAVSASVSSPVLEEKKPVPLDEQRRLFQRLWTDEDEIELLQGFLEYTTSRGSINSSHHHDTTAFYDQIKCKLQLDFNKNQLVEKLRRLKKKYRNVLNKIGSGKDYVFKSPHDQATFEISRKIWSGGGGVAPRGVVVAEEGGYDDEDANPNFNVHLIDQSSNPNPSGVDINIADKKTPRPRKRSRGAAVKIEEKQFGFNCGSNLQYNNQQHSAVQTPSVGVSVVTPMATPVGMASAPVTNLIEETVKSCLSPIFKELLHNVLNLNGPTGSSRGFGFAMSPMPLVLTGDLMADEKWRKQQILELEVYSRRLELVQDQIKAQLEELRSMGS